MSPDAPPAPTVLAAASPARAERPAGGPVPRPPLGLRKNFYWAFTGNAINAACQWGLLVLMAKIGSAAVVGRFSWAMAVAQPVISVAMLQLQAILVTDVRDRHRFADYLGLRLVGLALAMLVLVGYVAVMHPGWALSAVLLLVAGSRVIDGISDICRSLFQKLELMNLASGSMILRGVAAVPAVGLGIWLTGNLAVGMAALCGVWLLATLLYDLPLCRRLLGPGTDAEPSPVVPRFHLAAVRDLLPSAVPMGIVMGLIVLQTSIPRLFLEHWLGMDAVGYFSGALYPLTAGTIVVGALGQSSLPRLTRLFESDQAGFLRLLARLLLIGLALGLCVTAGAAALGRPFLRLAYKPDFASIYPEFVILSLATAVQFVHSFLSYGLMAARAFKIQPLIPLTACAACAAGCAGLVPRHGLAGAAIAYALSAAACFVVSASCMWWAVQQHRRQHAASPPDAARLPEGSS